MQLSGFDWDQGNWPKCGIHGVSRSQIEAVFAGQVAVFPAPARTADERRLIALGRATDGRTVLVVFTVRQRDGNDLIRPISARYVHEKERQHYDRQRAPAEKASDPEER